MNVAPSSGRKSESIIKFSEKANRGLLSLCLSQLQKYLSTQQPSQMKQTTAHPPWFSHSDTSAGMKCTNEKGGKSCFGREKNETPAKEFLKKTPGVKITVFFFL